MKNLIPVLFLSIFFVSCKDFKDPVFESIENVKMGEMTLEKPTIKLEMKYFNPNKYSAKLKNAEGDAWMDSSYLGHFTVDTTVAVPANAEFNIPVNLAIDMKTIMKNSLALLINPEVNIRITGTAKAGRNGFYKNFPLHYEGKQNLSKLLR
ncbi:MAG: hypothetical protein WDN26_02145, partial [Chitinophagaceae bacterium]